MKNLVLTLVIALSTIFGSCTHSLVADLMQTKDEKDPAPVEVAVTEFTESSLLTAMCMIDAKRHSRGVHTKKASAEQPKFLVNEVKEDLMNTLGLLHSYGQETELLFLKDLWMEEYRQHEFDKKYDVLILIGDKEIDGVLYLKEDLDGGIHKYEFTSDKKDYFIQGEGKRYQGASTGNANFNWMYNVSIGEDKVIAIKEETYQVFAAIDSHKKVQATEINFISPETITGNVEPIYQRIFTEKKGGHMDYYASFDHNAPHWYKVEDRVNHNEMTGTFKIVELENGSVFHYADERFSEIQFIENNKKSAGVSIRIIDSEHDEEIIVDNAELDDFSEAMVYDVLKEI